MFSDSKLHAFLFPNLLRFNRNAIFIRTYMEMQW